MSGQRQAADRRSLAPKTIMTPQMREDIVARRARGDAVKDIFMSLGSNRPSLRKVYQVIQEAKAIHDPKPARPRRPKAAPPVDQPAKPRRPERQALEGWWFGAETIVVTRLGFGSMDCLRVPVSVSCVPRGGLQVPVSAPVVALSVYRSLSEAMAEHPLVAGSQARDGMLQTEPGQRHPWR